MWLGGGSRLVFVHTNGAKSTDTFAFTTLKMVRRVIACHSSPQAATVCHSALRATVARCGSPWAAAGPHVPRGVRPHAVACPTSCGVPHVPWSARYLMSNLISKKYRIDERATHAAACRRMPRRVPRRAAACRDVPRRAAACCSVPRHAAACRSVPWRAVACHGKLWRAMACSPLSSQLQCRETYPRLMLEESYVK